MISGEIALSNDHYYYYLSDNRFPSSRKYGDSNSSSHNVMVKLESQNQRNKLLRIA